MLSYIICNKNYVYIIYLTIAYLTNSCIYYFNLNHTFETINISSEKFVSHNFIHRFFSFVGTFIISICFYQCEKYYSKSEKNEEAKNKKDNKHNLIYNDSENNLNNIEFILFYLFIVISWVSIDYIIEYYIMIFKDLDFWMFESIFVCYLNSKMFNVNIYEHQKLAIGISLLSGITKICTIILSFFEDKNTKYNYELPTFYIQSDKLYKNILIIVLGITLYFCQICLRAYINLKLKWFMDIKYISQNRLFIIYGFFGSLIYFLISLIGTFSPCKKTKEVHQTELYNYLCSVKNENSTLFYVENFNIYFSKFKEKEIFKEVGVIILAFITYFLKQYFSISIIKNLTPLHVNFTIPLIYFFQKIILITNTLVKKHTFFTDKYLTALKQAKFFLDLSGDIISIIGFLIYLEIIVIKCFKYENNIRYNLLERSIAEARESIDNLDDVTINEINENENSLNDS